MDQKPEKSRSARACEFDYDTTTVVLLGVLVLAGLICYYEHRQHRKSDQATQQTARVEGIATEQAGGEDNPAEQGDDEQAAAPREARDLERARQALRERIKDARRKIEQERAAREKEAFESPEDAAAEHLRRAIEARATRLEHEAAIARGQALKAAAAEERAAAEKEAARKQQIPDLQAQYRDAVRELKVLKAESWEIESKMAFCKERMDRWSRVQETFQRRQDELMGLSVAPHQDVPDAQMEMQVLKADLERAARNFQENKAGYSGAVEAREELAPRILRLKQRRDAAIMGLAALGVEASLSDQQKPPQKKTLTLRGGRRITAVLAVEAGDEWLIKSEDGKIETIPAAEVEKVETQ